MIYICNQLIMELDNIVDNRNKRTKYESDAGLNLYMTPPRGTLTLEECEDLAKQRFEALHIMEKKSNEKDLAHLFRSIKSHVFKANCIVLNEKDANQRNLDHLSHMIVRMYCIHHSDLWNWFKNCERKLLYYRLKDKVDKLSGGQLEDILRNFNFEFHRIIGTELSELYNEKLIGWNTNGPVKNIDIFKVKFTDALRFLSKRSVALKDGYAILTKYEIISIVCDVFERHLDEELNYARRHLNTEMLQIDQLLRSVHLVYSELQEKIEEERKKTKKESNDYQRNPYKMDLDMIDETSKHHFPPCMRVLHDSLVQDSHLRHFGRLYYGTFLKSGGVDVDSHTEFMRKHFTKTMTNDRFERDHKYNIRHIHGKEGHKKSLTCFSCEKIIKDNPPGPTDKHGCPFKHMDDNHLKSLMQKHEVKEVDIESIIMEKKSNNYQMACSYYFKARKGELPSDPIKNPAHFYYESMRLANREPPLLEDNEQLKLEVGVDNEEQFDDDEDDDEIRKALANKDNGIVLANKDIDNK